MEIKCEEPREQKACARAGAYTSWNLAKGEILADIRGSQMGRSSSDQETQAAVREKHQGEEQGNIPGQGKNRRHISEPTHRPSNASNYNSREHNPTVYSTSS